MPFVVDRKKFAKALRNVTQASSGIQYKAVFGRSKGTTLTIWFDSLLKMRKPLLRNWFFL